MLELRDNTPSLSPMTLAYTVSGLLVGLLVGLTGVGGGSLMTPLLTLMFGFSPATAVGTDLAFASLTKGVGTIAHRSHGHIRWDIVKRLCLGSLPAEQHRTHALAGLDEYDSGALLQAIHPAPLPKPDTPELYRHHFRLLCDALAQWMAGTISPRGMPSWDDFSGGVRLVLERVRHEHADENVLLVSSGGPISTAVGHVLGTSPEVTIALNMRIRNSAVTEFTTSPKRLMLQTFNTLNHLDTDEHRSWITHA